MARIASCRAIELFGRQIIKDELIIFTRRKAD